MMSMSTTASKRPALSDPDLQLMLRVRDGDVDAFTELVAKYQDRVLALFYNLVGDYEEAEDLTQETFLRVYRYRNRYRPTARFTTWLFTIVHNLAANARRSHRRKRAIRLADAVPDASGPQEFDWLVAKSRSAGTKVADIEMCELVREALGHLSERQRMALLLHKFEGLPYAEIAAIMDTTVPAIKSLLARARMQLRDLLAPYVCPEGSSDPGPSESKRVGHAEKTPHVTHG